MCAGIAAAAAAGDFVKVTGSVSEYRGMPQMVIKAMAALPPDAVNPEDFLPATDMDVDQLYERLVKITGPLRRPG